MNGIICEKYVRKKGVLNKCACRYEFEGGQIFAIFVRAYELNDLKEFRVEYEAQDIYRKVSEKHHNY